MSAFTTMALLASVAFLVSTGCQARDTYVGDNRQFGANVVAKPGVTWSIGWYSIDIKHGRLSNTCSIGGHVFGTTPCVDRQRKHDLPQTSNWTYMSPPIAAIDGSLTCGTDVCATSDGNVALVETDGTCGDRADVAALLVANKPLAVIVLCRNPSLSIYHGVGHINRDFAARLHFSNIEIMRFVGRNMR